MTATQPEDEVPAPPPHGGPAVHSDRHLLAVIGPTATGKTALAIRLADRLGGEVINADSRQIYRGLDIGTAKPTAGERARVRHWLIDFVNPDEAFSLGRYLDLAHEALSDCWSRAVLPILVGGTGQYVWALLEGWQVPRVPPDLELRAQLKHRAAEEGPQSLLDELRRVDPVAAERIDHRNLRRVIRALEFHHATGQPISVCQTREPPDWRWQAIALDCPRDELYRRIDARVDAMVAVGLFDEVRGLIDRGYHCDLSAMSGIGYRQICQHLAGELSFEDAVARIKTGTHRLARKQRAWFRRTDERIEWLAADDEPLPAALRVVESKLRPMESER